MPADRAPGCTGPGECLGDKLLRRVLVADADHDGAEALIPGPAVELREVRSLGSRTHSSGGGGGRLRRAVDSPGEVTLARYSSFAIVMWMPWTVSLHPEAEAELRRIPAAERAAVLNAAQKLEALGPDLGYPHSSAVRDADRLRELRPRAGRSPWRGFYRRFGDVFVLAAVGPEAEADPRGFKRAVVAAEERLEEVEGL
jgi:hypothetical protein